MFSVETKQAIESFPQALLNCPPKQLATSYENSNKVAYTQNRMLVIVDMARKSAEDNTKPL